MNFQSLNFKIVVINALRSLGYFREEFNSLIDQFYDDDNYSYEPIPEILDFCKNLELKEEQLAQVDFISFDGSSETYHDIIPNWDGEDESFDVDTIIDVLKLPNLKEFHAISMLTTNDYSPLLKLEKLKLFQLPYKFSDDSLKEKLFFL